MNDLFFQDEIDVLLYGVDFGVVEIDIDVVFFGEVCFYDFVSQDCIICGCMLILEMVNECFVCLWWIGLFNLIWCFVELLVCGIELIKFNDYMYLFYVLINLNLICFKFLCGIGLIVFELILVFVIVDNFFGGDGCYLICIEGCEFIVMEMWVIYLLFKQIFVDLQEVWVLVMDVELEYINFEINLYFVNIVMLCEYVVVCWLYVEFDGGGGDIYVILFYLMFELICELFDVGIQSDCNDCDVSWGVMLCEQFNIVEVILFSVLVSKCMSLCELICLKIGDIFLIELLVQVLVCVENILVFIGEFGIVNGSNVVKIIVIYFLGVCLCVFVIQEDL